MLTAFDQLVPIDKRMDLTLEDHALGTTGKLAEDIGSLSKYIIPDYFASDKLQIRRLDLKDSEPEKNIEDISGEDEQLSESDLGLSQKEEVSRMMVTPPNAGWDPPVNLSEKLTNEACCTWEVALPLVIVFVALAHLLWMETY